MKAPSIPIIKQGKFECASASLAMLLGHTHFMVKSVMGEHGWCNDFRGAGDDVLRATARAFGRDLVRAGRNTIRALDKDLPDCLATVPSLNYKGRYHGVARINGETIDPNFGHPTRKYWGADATLEEMETSNILILTREPLSDFEHRQIAGIRKYSDDALVREAILRVAG